MGARIGRTITYIEVNLECSIIKQVYNMTYSSALCSPIHANITRRN